MAQDFFNKKNGENIYLNNASAGSVRRWHDVMPKCVLLSVVRSISELNAEADFQFNTTAEKFDGNTKMGGNATPWTSASH